MPEANFIIPLAKVIIAAAWADGEVQPEELNSLKDLLFALPELTQLQWAELEMFIETPPTDEERNFLLMELQGAIATEGNKQMALKSLQNMLQADGIITPEEQEVGQVIQHMIEAVDTSIFDQFANLFRESIVRRSSAVAKTYNREQYFDAFVKNKVYYAVRRRLDLGEVDLNIPDDILQKLGLAGGMLALIASSSDGVNQKEIEAIADALESGWQITHEEAAIVAEVAVADESQNLDRFRITREFAGLCTMAERQQFLDALFAVAVADGMVSPSEMDEIRQIAHSLKLSNQTFVEAKLKIPRSQRPE